MFICDIDIEEEYPKVSHKQLIDVLVHACSEAGNPVLPATFLTDVYIDGSMIHRIKLHVIADFRDDNIYGEMYTFGQSHFKITTRVTRNMRQALSDAVTQALEHTANEYEIMSKRASRYAKQLQQFVKKES